MLPFAKKHGIKILPTNSKHSTIFQVHTSAIFIDLFDKTITCLFSRSIVVDAKVQIVPMVNLGFFLHNSAYKDYLKVDYNTLFYYLWWCFQVWSLSLCLFFG